MSVMIPRTVLRRFRPAATSSTLRQPISTYLQPRLLSQHIPAPTRARIAARWYSDNAKAAEAGASDESLGDAEPPQNAQAEDPLKKELEAKSKEAAEFKDKYLRQVADFRNLQERTKRDMTSARDFAIQKFAKDLVESVDNLDLALQQVAPEKLADPAASTNTGASAGDVQAGASSEAAPVANADPNKELRQLHSGLKMVETILMNTLKKHGLERVDPSINGEKFNPNVHEATFMAPQPGKEDGSCFHTTQKGFMLNGRVIRPAKVGVVKNS